MATVVDQPQDAGSPSQDTGTAEATASAAILEIRSRINEIDDAIIALWKERAALSQQVGATRVRPGGRVWC